MDMYERRGEPVVAWAFRPYQRRALGSMFACRLVKYDGCVEALVWTRATSLLRAVPVHQESTERLSRP